MKLLITKYGFNQLISNCMRPQSNFILPYVLLTSKITVKHKNNTIATCMWYGKSCYQGSSTQARPGVVTDTCSILTDTRTQAKELTKSDWCSKCTKWKEQDDRWRGHLTSGWANVECWAACPGSSPVVRPVSTARGGETVQQTRDSSAGVTRIMDRQTPSRCLSKFWKVSGSKQ